MGEGGKEGGDRVGLEWGRFAIGEDRFEAGHDSLCRVRVSGRAWFMGYSEKGTHIVSGQSLFAIFARESVVDLGANMSDALLDC